MKRWMLALVLCGSPAFAESRPDPLQAFAREPSVAVLQRAAARLAELHPARVRSWLSRVRKAAILPVLKLRAGHGTYGVTLASGTSYVPANETWRLEAEATWSLDRLVFDRNELGLSRESQRLAARREQLLTEVAQLYYARRRLQVEAVTTPGSEADALDRQLGIDELTAVLDGLTDGALSKGNP